MSTTQTSRSAASRAASGSPRGSGLVPTPVVDPFRVLRKHLTVVLAAGVFGVLFGVAAWLLLVMFAPRYSSTVRFEIVAAIKDASQVVPGDLDKDDVVIRLARTEMTIILSRPVLRAAMSHPDIQTTVWSRGFRTSDGTFQIEEAVDELEDDLVVRYLPETNLFELVWSYGAKEDVPVVLNNIERAYTRFRDELEAGQYQEDLKVFTDQEANINRELRSLNTQMQNFVRDHSIYTLDQIRDHPLAYEVKSLTETLSSMKSQMSLLQTQYEQIQQKLSGQLDPSPEDRLFAEQNRSVLTLIDMATNMKVRERLLIDKFGPDHPDVKEIQMQLRAAEDQKEAQIDEVIQRNLTGTAKNILNSMEAIRGTIEEVQMELQDRDTQLKEVAAQVSEYQSLSDRRDQHMMELQSTRELKTELQRVRLRSAADRVRTATVAETPREKSFPKPEIIIPLGFLLVVGGTLGVIFLRELTDKRVKSASDLSVVPGARVLGVVPDLREDPTRITKAELAVRDDPRSVVAESYRQTCTPILKAMDLNGHQSLVVVGGLPGAGSTTVVSNLAAFIAAGGQRVIAVDANFRRPALARVLGAKNPEAAGLGDVLNGQSTVGDVVTSVKGGIDVVTAGTPANRIFERLNNGKLESLLAELRSRYDYILVDAPPAVVAGDALVLANKTDASVLVVRANQEQRGLVARLISQFNEAHGTLLGVVLNRPRWTAGGYFKKNFATMAEYASASGKSAE